MIIACPACATRYVVPDTAIGVDGRTVRCAKCRHSWFQEGPELVGAAGGAAARAAASGSASAGAASAGSGGASRKPATKRPEAPASPPSVTEPEPLAARAERPAPASPAPASPVVDPAPEPEPRSKPVPEPEVAAAVAASAVTGFAVQDAEPETAPPPVPVSHDDAGPRRSYPTFNHHAAEYEDSASAFDYEPPFRARKNPARMWSYAAMLFAVVSLGLVGAVAWYGLPDWMPMSRPLFAEAQPDLIIEFPPDLQDRRTLPNGTAFFGASGTITNVGQTRRTVPMILIVLRDVEDRIVYTQPVAPPKRQLGPGESVTINEALTDVPNSAKYAEFGWKPG